MEAVQYLQFGDARFEYGVGCKSLSVLRSASATPKLISILPIHDSLLRIWAQTTISRMAHHPSRLGNTSVRGGWDGWPAR